jgi:hypothetical protein
MLKIHLPKLLNDAEKICFYDNQLSYTSKYIIETEFDNVYLRLNAS